VTTPSEDTPIRQRRLFPEARHRESDDDDDNDDDEEVEDTTQRNGAWLLGRIQNQSRDIDMALVKIEAEEDGDGDSNCSAAKAGELFASVLESATDRREVVVLEDKKNIVCDSPHNMIEIKRGLAPEVKVSAPPADWVPDRIKLECAEPASFLVIDNPGGWGQYTFCPKFHNKARERISRRGNILIMRYLLVQDQFLRTTKEKGRRLDGPSTTKDGRMMIMQILEAVRCTKIPSMTPKRGISTMSYSSIYGFDKG
jgi:hypothetical protein